MCFSMKVFFLKKYFSVKYQNLKFFPLMVIQNILKFYEKMKHWSNEKEKDSQEEQ